MLTTKTNMYYANYKNKHVLSNYFSLLSFSKEKHMEVPYNCIMLLFFSTSVKVYYECFLNIYIMLELFLGSPTNKISLFHI